MPIDDDKTDKVTRRRTSTEPHGVFGEPSDDRPIVTEQRSDPTHGRAEPSEHAVTKEGKRDKASARSDEEMQRSSESGVGRAAEERRAADGVDDEGRSRQ
jgi:hypothetical protein